MASDISPYLGNRILRWLGGNAMPTAPTTLYLGLFSSNPKTGGTEITTTIRTAGRLDIPLSVPVAGTAVAMPNSADVDFGLAAGDASLTHVGVFDAAAAGNLLWSKPVPGGPIAIDAGAAVKFNGGDVVFNVGSAS